MHALALIDSTRTPFRDIPDVSLLLNQATVNILRHTFVYFGRVWFLEGKLLGLRACSPNILIETSKSPSKLPTSLLTHKWGTKVSISPYSHQF